MTMMYRQWGKRFLDLTLTGVVLLCGWPLLIFLALLVRLKLGTPVLFRQQRPGLHGRPFIMVKFRTMTDARDAHGQLLSDAQRLTAFGKFLRATSLDELPELWNVFKGEMSLVGPRPLLEKYMPYYTSEENTRHTVRPGITGWAQVQGRNNVPWDTRLGYDVWYVKNLSLKLDVQIIFLTALKVIRRQDVQTDPRSIMRDLDEERRERVA